MNRDLYKVRGQILDYLKKSGKQPTSNPEEERKPSGEIDERIAETLGGGNTPAIEKIITDTRKHLKLE
jgi:hypothetical protein